MVWSSDLRLLGFGPYGFVGFRLVGVIRFAALGVVVGFRAVAVAASMRGPGDYGMLYVFESGCLELSG